MLQACKGVTHHNTHTCHICLYSKLPRRRIEIIKKKYKYHIAKASLNKCHITHAHTHRNQRARPKYLP